MTSSGYVDYSIIYDPETMKKHALNSPKGIQILKRLVLSSLESLKKTNTVKPRLKRTMPAVVPHTKKAHPMSTSPSIVHTGKKRIIVLGDIHGNLPALIDTLQRAQLLTSDDKWCGRKNDILVQVGDVVDRGHEDLEALRLLRDLQNQANKSQGKQGRVIRLIGNHELMILSGQYRSTHPSNNKDRVSEIKRLLLESLKDKSLLACFHYGNMIFLHAGVSESYCSDNIPSYSENLSGKQKAAQIAQHLNSSLWSYLSSIGCFQTQESACLSKTKACWEKSACPIGEHSLTSGDGPFWIRTRCSRNADTTSCVDNLPEKIVQVVGHTNDVQEGMKQQFHKIIYTDMGLYHSMYSKAYTERRGFLELEKNQATAHQWSIDSATVDTLVLM